MGLNEPTEPFKNLANKLTVRQVIINEHKNFMIGIKILITLAIIVMGVLMAIGNQEKTKDIFIGMLVSIFSIWFFFR